MPFDTAGEELAQRRLERAGNGYRPGQGSVAVTRSENIDGLICARLSFVDHDGIAVVYYLIKADKPGVRDHWGEEIPTDDWVPELGASAGIGSLSRLIPIAQVKLSPKMKEAADDAARRL